MAIVCFTHTTDWRIALELLGLPFNEGGCYLLRALCVRMFDLAIRQDVC